MLTKELQTVYRLFLVNLYLVHETETEADRGRVFNIYLEGLVIHWTNVTVYCIVLEITYVLFEYPLKLTKPWQEMKTRWHQGRDQV